MRWTYARKNHFALLIQSGFSNTEIAQKMGSTRAAICCQRIKLQEANTYPIKKPYLSEFVPDWKTLRDRGVGSLLREKEFGHV